MTSTYAPGPLQSLRDTLTSSLRKGGFNAGPAMVESRNSGGSVPGIGRSEDLVRFEGFELDLRTAELRKDGDKTVRLSEQPLRILITLLENPGKLVLREDLRKRLWPNDTIVEFEHSINAAMNRLRQALGDSAENPRFIETLARRGYRWKTPVEWGRRDGVAIQGRGPETRPPRSAQILARGTRGRPGCTGAVPARSSCCFGPGPSQHLHNL